MMSKAVPPQSTTHPSDVVPVPLLPFPSEPLAATGADRFPEDGDPRFLRPGLLQRVFTAAGEVETAEWMLDRILDDAAASDVEFGVGFDVEPVDGTLESARWALDQAVSALHAEIRAAARQGVPAALLAETSALEVEEVRAVLDAAGPHPAGEALPARPLQSRAEGLSGELAAVV